MEVLVSLVIFAGVGMAVLSWFQQNIGIAQKLRLFYGVQGDRRELLEFAKNLNPSEQPRGDVKLGSQRIVWAASPLGQSYIQSGYPGGVGRFQLQIYSVSLALFHGDESEPRVSQTMDIVGYRRAG